MMNRNWEVIERQAAKATDKDAETYDRLIQFLEVPVKNDLDRDVYMTRGLLYWLKCNAHQTNIGGKDSPLTLAAKMFSGKMVYADAFSTLCQKADILCETVEGISKTGEYKPGDLDVDKDKMKAYWNKVFLLGRWWPIHPRWVLRSVTVTPSSDPTSGGNTQEEFTFNEFWFLTPPEIFIYKCYPDKLEDQLLPASKRVKRPRLFMKLPYLTPLFYSYDLKLTSDESCFVYTTEGVARVSFKADKMKSKLLQCDCSLTIENKDKKGKTKLEEIEQTYDPGKLVFSSRKKGHFVFEVRCPKVASYQLVISGGLPGEENKVLLKTKIVCKEQVIPALRTLPLEVGTLGWGFNPVMKAAGLSKPSVKDPKMFVEPKATRKTAMAVLRFKMDSSVNKSYKAELYAKGKTSDILKDCVKTIADKKKQELRIEITVPEHGEYALVIKAGADSKPPKCQIFKPVCNYLLTTLEAEEKVVDDYFDSSDGTSDIDDEIEDLQKTLRDITERRNKLHVKPQLRLMSQRSLLNAF